MVVKLKYLIKILFVYVVLFFTPKIVSHKILLISIPKCGTHLLAKGLEIISKKELAPEIKIGDIIKYGISKLDCKNYFYRCHLPYFSLFCKQLINENYKLFFIYRDPRDHVISRAFWIQKRQEKKQSIQELIDYCIKDVKRCYYRYLGWKNNENVCTVKFEHLIGELGGGSNEQQLDNIKKICEYLDIELNDSLIEYCSKNIYGDTFTFREGKIGSWDKYFTEKQKRNFKKIAGKLLIKLGYEKNFDW